ncbi:MAG: 30S ribosome-binding factor RbfA [Chloroflexi bacterium]|nr:MAG: 30S ribosome-binding factor RbfA [Chloroflexota bacterium]
MASRRQRQVAELLHEEISQLLQHGTRDPRLGFVTVTGVEVTPDLRSARVFVTVLGDDADAKSTLEGLASAARFFRHQLGQTLSLRYIPELNFRLDTSLEYGNKIDRLLDSIQQESGPQPEADTPANTNQA